MRHANVNLWTWNRRLCLDPHPQPWLRIYTGMPADSLSCCVNIPPDYSLFAQIQKADPKHSHHAHFSLPAFTSKLIILPWLVSASSNSDSVSLPFNRHSISHLTCFQTRSSCSPLQMFRQLCLRITKDCLLTSDNTVPHWVNSTQIKEKLHFRYHFSNQQGDRWTTHVSLTWKRMRSFN